MEMQCIFCEVGNEFLNVIYINFMLQRVKKIWPRTKLKPVGIYLHFLASTQSWLSECVGVGGPSPIDVLLVVSTFSGCNGWEGCWLLRPVLPPPPPAPTVPGSRDTCLERSRAVWMVCRAFWGDNSDCSRFLAPVIWESRRGKLARDTGGPGPGPGAATEPWSGAGTMEGVEDAEDCWTGDGICWVLDLPDGWYRFLPGAKEAVLVGVGMWGCEGWDIRCGRAVASNTGPVVLDLWCSDTWAGVCCCCACGAGCCCCWWDVPLLVGVCVYDVSDVGVLSPGEMSMSCAWDSPAKQR